jgi:polyhydroxybutyrate depolymerase
VIAGWSQVLGSGLTRMSRAQKAGLVLLVVLALTVSCSVAYRASVSGGSASPGSSARAVPVGRSTQTVSSGGRVRTFHLYRPATLASPAPLVVMLHGGFGSGTQAEASYGWDGEADAHHFLVAYPDGVDRAWNVGGGCCGTPAQSGVDDSAFISAMVAQLRGEVSLDPARLYATGISNGGMLAYHLACTTRLFAAIGPDSATELGDCSAPVPLSVIHIHGTADHNIPYDGGPGNGPARIDGPSVPSLIGQWRMTDRCAAPSQTVAAAVTTSIATCPGGRAVELITIAGAGHQWPGGVSHPVEERLLHLDPPSKALNATDVIWAFFDAHPAGS